MMKRCTRLITAHTPCCFMTACYRAFIFIKMESIEAKFSHITPRYEKTFNVVFKAIDGENLNTICKWLKNSHDVNHYISYDNGYVVGCNDEGKYRISEVERMKAVDAVFNAL